MSEAQYVLLHTSPLEVQTSKFDSLLSLSAFFHKNHKSALRKLLQASLCDPEKRICPPDVKIETTFFQRKFFITTPCNHPQKQHKKRTSDLSEVPILRCFLKILPLSAPLPASYQIPPDCTLNGIYPSNDTSFLYPIRTFSISFAALAHC